MAILQIPEISDQLVQAYTNASKEELKQMEEQTITAWTQTPPGRWLQRGSHKPFKPFKAVKMRGEGPSASEMVIQDRM